MNPVTTLLCDLDFVRVTNLEGVSPENFPDALGIWYSGVDANLNKRVYAVWTMDGELWVALSGGRKWLGDFFNKSLKVAPGGRYAFHIPSMGKLLARQMETRALDPTWEPGLVM